MLLGLEVKADSSTNVFMYTFYSTVARLLYWWLNQKSFIQALEALELSVNYAKNKKELHF